MTLLTDVQQVLATLAPVDNAGNPAPISNPSWNAGDTTILTVTPSADGLSATIVAVGKLGTSQVSVTCNPVKEDGTPDSAIQLAGTLDVQVVASEAATLGITVGTPTSK